jgi:hypothetical protein
LPHPGKSQGGAVAAGLRIKANAVVAHRQLQTVTDLPQRCPHGGRWCDRLRTGPLTTLFSMAGKAKIPAIAYLRTSSPANVGADKDSDRRQGDAIPAFATRASYMLVDGFYDAAVSGADPIDSRPGFVAMLERIEANGVRTIIVETASRFARDLMVQEVGHAKLRERGIDLIAADNPGSFIDDTPTAKLVRQVLGAISEFDKAMTVAKLRGARERKHREVGNVKAARTMPSCLRG